jgi:hypothetical protein
MIQISPATPELVRFRTEHAAVGDTEVVSIAFEDQPQALQDFFAAKGGGWPVVLNDDARMALEFGVTGVPESFVVAPSGQIVAHFNGVTAEALDGVIAQYGEAPPGTAP